MGPASLGDCLSSNSAVYLLGLDCNANLAPRRSGDGRMRHSSTPMPVALALVFLGSVTLALAGQDCRCGGTPTAQPHKGGDGQPLKWEYEQNIVQPGYGQIPQVVCYRREVENDSASDVRDVRWEVASFFRSVIRKGDQQTSCPAVAGDVSANPSNGPIHFGPGTDSYDTTVFLPRTVGISRRS